MVQAIYSKIVNRHEFSGLLGTNVPVRITYHRECHSKVSSINCLFSACHCLSWNNVFDFGSVGIRTTSRLCRGSKLKIEAPSSLPKYIFAGEVCFLCRKEELLNVVRSDVPVLTNTPKLISCIKALASMTGIWQRS